MLIFLFGTTYTGTTKIKFSDDYQETNPKCVGKFHDFIRFDNEICTIPNVLETWTLFQMKNVTFTMIWLLHVFIRQFVGNSK